MDDQRDRTSVFEASAAVHGVGCTVTGDGETRHNYARPRTLTRWQDLTVLHRIPSGTHSIYPEDRIPHFDLRL